MGQGTKWSAEEMNYLEGVWGRVSLQTICKNLGRSYRAIKVKAHRMNLGGFFTNSDMISLKQLLLLLGYKDYSRGTKNHILKSGLPIKKRRLEKTVVLMVSIPEFWEWAGSHRDFFKYNLLEPLILGKEPDWVSEQRHIDYKCKFAKRPWAPADDRLLEFMVKKGESTTAIAERLNRSERAIASRCWYLGLDAPKRERRCPRWTEAENEMLRELWGKRYPLKYIAQQIGRSEIGVEHRIWKMKLKEAANG